MQHLFKCKWFDLKEKDFIGKDFQKILNNQIKKMKLISNMLKKDNFKLIGNDKNGFNCYKKELK